MLVGLATFKVGSACSYRWGSILHSSYYVQHEACRTMRTDCGGILGDLLTTVETLATKGNDSREDSICLLNNNQIQVDTTTRHPGAKPMSRPSHIQEPNRLIQSIGMTPVSSIRITSPSPSQRQHQSMIAHAHRLRQKKKTISVTTASPQHFKSAAISSSSTPSTPSAPTRGIQRTRSGSFRAQRDDNETIRHVSTKMRLSHSLSNDTSMVAVRPPPAGGGNDERDSDEKTCDYESAATVLYELLEASSWAEAKDRSRSHPNEVKTWIMRRDKNHQVRWKLLPLHASIIFQAPSAVVISLLQSYTQAAQKTDDQGMLPLHLAFRHKQDDEELLEALLKHFPKSVRATDNRNRLPLDHARDLKFSSKIMKIYAEASIAANEAHRHQPVAPEANLTNLKHKHTEEIRRLKAVYEEKIHELRERIDKDAKQSKVVVEERERLIERHNNEIAQLREVLRAQADRDTTVIHDLRAKIVDFKSALDNASKQNDTWEERHRAMEEYGNELRIQLHSFIQDQILIRDLASRQANELDAARKMRSKIITTLVQQEGTDAHNDSMRAAKLLQVAESVRERIQQLLQGDPMDEQLSRPSRMDLERSQAEMISRPLDLAQQEQEQHLDSSTEIICLENYTDPARSSDEDVAIRTITTLKGDEISAITMHSS